MPSHWHEWVQAKVLLVRDELEQPMLRPFKPTEIKYKRCRKCGKVLF